MKLQANRTTFDEFEKDTDMLALLARRSRKVWVVFVLLTPGGVRVRELTRGYCLSPLGGFEMGLRLDCYEPGLFQRTRHM